LGIYGPSDSGCGETDFKEVGSTLHLIQNHQTAEHPEYPLWTLKGSRILGILEVGEMALKLAGQSACKGGFSRLPRAEEGNGGRPLEALLKRTEKVLPANPG
jgi:hypothetical protein